MLAPPSRGPVLMTKETDQRSQSPDGLIALLDSADRRPGANELRALSYALLGSGPGMAAVDVGCGAGRAVAELTERGVKDVGVDPSERMIAIARGRRPEADFRIAGAYEPPLADASVDGYRADKVIHELAEPERALTEARRVLRHGGRIVLLGQDWETIIVDSADPALTPSDALRGVDGKSGPLFRRRS